MFIVNKFLCNDFDIVLNFLFEMYVCSVDVLLMIYVLVLIYDLYFSYRSSSGSIVSFFRVS